MTHAASTASAEARFRTLFHATYTDLRSFAMRRVEDEAVDDVVADTYLVAWRRLEQVPQDNGEALLWLYRVAQYGVLNVRRGVRRRLALRARLRATTPTVALGADRIVELDDEADLLAHAFASLTEDDRSILLLAAWEGLSGERLASVLDISPTAATTRLSRARARFEAAVLAAEASEAQR